MIIPHIPYITAEDVSGVKRVVSQIYNIPIQRAPFHSKEEMELFHLKNFQQKLQKEHSTYNFDILNRGDTGKNKRPDFYIERANKTIGIELTMFMFRKLREEVKFFAKIKKRLLEAYYSGKLKNLWGVHFEIRFGDITKNTPVEINNTELDQLITAWNQILEKPFDQITQLWSDDETQLFDPNKKVYPVGENGSIKNGLIVWEVNYVSDAPIDGATDFAKQTGFEVSHGLTSYTEKMVFEEFQNTIDKKDISCNKDYELLVSSGLPDKDGWITTLEDMVLTQFITKLEIKAPQYLSRVFLDSGFHGEYFVIYDKKLSLK